MLLCFYCFGYAIELQGSPSLVTNISQTRSADVDCLRILICSKCRMPGVLAELVLNWNLIREIETDQRVVDVTRFDRTALDVGPFVLCSVYDMYSCDMLS